MELDEAWNDLLQRATGNVFMSPEVLCAVPDSSQIHLLQAWDEGASPRRLVGFWALRERSPMNRPRHWLGPAALLTIPTGIAYVTNPVIDVDYIDDVVAAFFEAIRRAPGLPGLIQLVWFDASAPEYEAMRHRLGWWRYREYERDDRPCADQHIGVKKSGSTRKKLGQQWRRLEALPGGVEITEVRSPVSAVENALETFLEMELGQWKGEQGTAILSKSYSALFTRSMVANLAKSGNASVALLKIDGRAVASLVVLYCGSRAYAWRSAIDPEFADYSPGIHLADKITDRLLSGDEVTFFDSCSYSHGYLGRLWDGRYPVVNDAIIDVRPYLSLPLLREIITWEMHRVHRRIKVRILPAIKQKLTSLGSRLRGGKQNPAQDDQGKSGSSGAAGSSSGLP
jgi:hypothetical protein